MLVLSVVGNRPEFIKSAPLSAALRAAGIDEIVLHTGQHYDPELSEVFFRELGLGEPRYHLDWKKTDVRDGVRAAVEAEEPDWVIVFGDTNSTLVAAEGAGDVPIAHVEAGLRSFDLSMPEERIRIAVDRMAALLTPLAAGLALEHDATRLAFGAMCGAGAVVAGGMLVTSRRLATA